METCWTGWQKEDLQGGPYRLNSALPAGRPVWYEISKEDLFKIWEEPCRGGLVSRQFCWDCPADLIGALAVINSFLPGSFISCLFRPFLVIRLFSKQIPENCLCILSCPQQREHCPVCSMRPRKMDLSLLFHLVSFARSFWSVSMYAIAR